MAATTSQAAIAEPAASSDNVIFADSPFLPSPDSHLTIAPNARAIAHLTRDILQPVLVLPAQSSVPSTPEPVANLKRKAPSSSSSLNTRFGSFPHSSLLVTAGSQVRSSSGSGFIHILRPTPELWTASLPHRTQVVYTPDSSYILHRLRVRPGSRIIEAGAGSGSFTHTSARAVYNGILPGSLHSDNTAPNGKENGITNKGPNGEATGEPVAESVQVVNHGDSQGRVFSFEFHADRASILKHELRQHGLHDIVTITNRDVCALGFALTDPGLNIGGNTYATAVFLDLPAPWLAIPHLNRENGSLSRQKSVRICCFSPCLEQALRTIAVLREAGWTEEELVEVGHKRLEVRRIGVTGREVGSKAKGPPGDDDLKVTSVGDTVTKLKKQLWHRKEKQANQRERIAKKRKLEAGAIEEDEADEVDDMNVDLPADEDDDEAAGGDQGQSKLHLFKHGRVTVRTEPELKTHTSYLVFAVLPLPWTAADEEEAKIKHPLPSRPAAQINPATGRDYTSGMKGPKLRPDGKLSKRQEKKLKRAAEYAAKQATVDESKLKTEDAED